jgi:hypothetical protein
MGVRRSFRVVTILRAEVAEIGVRFPVGTRFLLSSRLHSLCGPPILLSGAKTVEA